MLNSGIRNDDRIIVDTFRSLGSFAGQMKEDMEMQRRLLSNEMQDLNHNLRIDHLDALTQNKQVAEKYQRSSRCLLASLNMHAMC